VGDPPRAADPTSATRDTMPPLVTATGATPPTPTYRSWQPGLIPLRPQTFGDFITVPFKAMRYNRGVIVGGPLLFVLVAMLVGGAALWLVFTDPQLALLNPVSQLSGVRPQTIAVAALAAVALVLADVFSSAIVAPGIARAILGERIALPAALRAVRARAGALLGLYGLSMLAGLVTIAPGGLVTILGAVNSDTPEIVIGVLLMLVLALPGGLVIGVVGGVARSAVVLERQGAVAAIRRAAGVIRGRFWWSVLIVLVTGAVINLAAGAVQQIGSFGGLFAGALAPTQATVALIVTLVLTIFLSVISYVFIYAYMGGVYTLIYVDARIRHEGFDMDLARAAEARRA
jgi:hypothetical protein